MINHSAAIPVGPFPPLTPEAAGWPLRRRLPLSELAALLAEHPAAVEAFRRRVWSAGGPGGHWFWLGAISDSGHGKMQIGSRRGGTAIVALTHRIAWVLSGGDCSSDAVIRHDCDESICLNPSHLRRGSMADNSADWVSRRHRLDGPLADIRGLAGRARAIRAALLAAEATDPRAQVEASARAAAAGARHSTQLGLLEQSPMVIPPIRDGATPTWRAPASVVDPHQPGLW